MDCFCAQAGCGRYQISGMATVCGRDLNILLCGGTQHHIGAVALSTPENKIQTLLLPSHRDDSVVAEAAERFSSAFHCSVCVSAGIHIDCATPAEIQILVENCRACCDALEKKLSTRFLPREQGKR